MIKKIKINKVSPELITWSKAHRILKIEWSKRIEWSKLWVERDIQGYLIQPPSQYRNLCHSNPARWSPVLCLSTPRACYSAVALMGNSGCQIVYLDGDPKTACLEPPSPETTEKKSIVSSSWQCFSYWKTALLSSLSLLPFKPNIPDCCNCFLSNQVPIPLAIWISFSTLVFLELCWLWPTERNLFFISSVHIYLHINETQVS